jgi:phospholipid/cholesterol/gamma-HCH transport system ATP-binding protein
METTLEYYKEKETGKGGTECVISIDHIYKSFGNHDVLIDFSLKIYKGENVVIFGKSGSGKSVLIKCIIGLLRPDRGNITVLNQDVIAMNHVELDQMRAKVGFLFQSNALYDSMTVRENLEFPLRRHWIILDQAEVDKLVEESLEDVGLLHTIDLMPSELSGGMRKRIALARTLILKPQIILYDEPTTGLDPITGNEIIDLMIEIQKKYNTASLVISHDMNCIRKVSDKVVMLIDGRCYKVGSFQEVSSSADPKIKSFFS